MTETDSCFLFFKEMLEKHTDIKDIQVEQSTNEALKRFALQSTPLGQVLFEQ